MQPFKTSKEIPILPEQPGQQEFVGQMLNGSQRKTAYALRLNVERLIGGETGGEYRVWEDQKTGRRKLTWKNGNPQFLHCTGFLTLTVGDHVCEVHGKQVVAGGSKCPKCGLNMRFEQVFDAVEASRRVDNLRRRVLSNLFDKAIIVTERHKTGAIHFHVVGRLRSRKDIRGGFDWSAVRKRDYRSVSPYLRGVWAMLRDTLPGYGFGRAELMPIEKDSEAVASYISKYIEKNVCNRLASDKRKKLVRYIGWEKEQLKPNLFSWATPRAKAWWGKVRELCGLVEVRCEPEADLTRPVAEVFGPRWAFHLTRMIVLFSDQHVPWMQFAGFPDRELARAELVKLSGSWMRERAKWHERRRGWLDGFRDCAADARQMQWPRQVRTVTPRCVTRPVTTTGPVPEPLWGLRKDASGHWRTFVVEKPCPVMVAG